MFNVEKIKSKSNSEIYNLYMTDINNIYLEFDNLNITKDKYLKIVMEVIENTKRTYTGEDTYIKYLTDEILFKLFLASGDLCDMSNQGNDAILNYRTEDVNLYAIELSKIPLLTAEEEKMLAYQISRGDKEAEKKFIEGNLRLVVKIACMYVGKGISWNDLIQEGNIGLINAVRSYDVSKGYKFSTHAFRIIKQHMIKAISQARVIKLPYDVSADIYKYDKAYEQLLMEFGKKPTDEEIANKMNISIAKLERIKKYKINIFSLDDENDINNNELVVESINRGAMTEDECLKKEFSRELRDLLKKSKLTKKELEVVSLGYGLDGDKPLNMCEIAALRGIKKQGVSQSMLNALRKIRRSGLIDDFGIYLDNPREGERNLTKMRDKYKTKNLKWIRSHVMR